MRRVADFGKRFRRVSTGRTPHRPVGPLVWTVLVLGALALGAVAAPRDMGQAAIRVVFLIVAPALPVFLALRALDLLARTILAATAALVVNAVVAEVMLLTGSWSLAGGELAVALTGVVLAVVGHLRSPADPLAVDSDNPV